MQQQIIIQLQNDTYTNTLNDTYYVRSKLTLTPTTHTHLHT